MELPSFAAWQSVAGELGLWRRGAELVGPCPSCGGEDRFHVNDKRRAGTAALFGCRRCNNVAAILKAAFPDRLANGANRPAPSAQRKAAAPSKRSGKPKFDDAACKREARRWWRNAAPVTDDTPAYAYLATRRSLAPAKDAEQVRWLDKTPWLQLTRTGTRHSTPPVYPKAKPPAQAAGAILYPYRNRAGRVVAVSVEPLDKAGRKAQRRDGNRAGFVVGRLSDAWHMARPRDQGRPVRDPRHAHDLAATGRPPIAVCEGALDAWAIAAATGTEAWAAGGASVMPAKASALAATGREIQLWPDGDPPGRRAAGELQALLLNAGATVRVVHAQPGSDPHEQLTGDGT